MAYRCLRCDGADVIVLVCNIGQQPSQRRWCLYDDGAKKECTHLLMQQPSYSGLSTYFLFSSELKAGLPSYLMRLMHTPHSLAVRLLLGYLKTLSKVLRVYILGFVVARLGC
eukprot:7309019-Pyramimonas_sp.AAC.1